jgi:hypothetical protein
MTADAKPRKTWLSAGAKRRIRRALLGIAIGVPLAVAATWYAANHVPWFGAWLADTLRSVLGTDRVAELEEFTYDLEDRWNRWWRSGEKPKAYWESPSSSPSGLGPSSVRQPPSSAEQPSSSAPSPPSSGSGAPSAAASAGEAPSGNGTFPPRDVGPYDAKFAAPGDGVWVAVPVPGPAVRPTAAAYGQPSSAPEPLLYKTLIHPDSKRPWAEVFVVAGDPATAMLHVVAGTREPKGTAPGSGEAKRTGLVADSDVASLMAAFNGGFKEEHGHYGMKVDGVLLIRPRVDGCTIAMTADGAPRIAPWKAVADVESTFLWWRQTPACLVTGGKLHPALYDENTNWGAALGGATVVRRSALGLSADGKVLFVAVSNHTSPRAIAVAMLHAGAVDVAQLDINYSYPRFVVFPKGESGQREATSLFEGFKVEKDDHLRTPSVRDFFYLTRR